MPRPGAVTSPAIARARPRYGDGSRQSLAMTPSSRSCAAAVSAARTRQITSRSPFSSRRASTSMPRKPVAPVRKTGELHASTSSRSGTICVPIAWKPPSTWMISAVMRAGGVAEQEVDRLGHGRRVLDVPRQRGLLLPRGREVAEARDAARGQRRQRPGGHQVHAHAARAEVTRQVARGGLQRGLGHAHPVIDRPRDLGVEVEPDDRRALLGEQVARARRSAPSASTPTS